MSDIKLDENLQPVFLSSKDWETISGRDEFEQWFRLEAKKRLYGTISKYNKDNVESKIELTISRLVRSTNYINSVGSIEVQNLDKVRDSEKSGYKVTAKFGESENLILFFDGI